MARSRTRAARPAARSARSGASRGGSFGIRIPDPLTPRRTIALALIVAGASGFTAFLPLIPAIAPYQRYLAETFGLALVFPIFALLALGGIVFAGHEAQALRPSRPLAGGLLLAVALTGLSSFLPPTTWGRSPLGLPPGAWGGTFGSALAFDQSPLVLLALVAVAVFGVLLLARVPLSSLARLAGELAAQVWRFVRWLAPRLLAAVVWGIGQVRALVARLAAAFRQYRERRAARAAERRAAVVAEAEVSIDEPTVAPPKPAPKPAKLPLPKIKPAATKPAESNAIAPRPSTLPPMDLLDGGGAEEARPADRAALEQRLLSTLADFGVEEARVVAVNQGPTITQFGIEPGWQIKRREIVERDAEGKPLRNPDGSVKVRVEEVSRQRVKVAKITALANDLALALAAPSIRIEAPVPGRPYMGIEVPNQTMSVVSLRSVMESPQFQKLQAKSRLALALGKGVDGHAVVGDLAKFPHLLIAGSTGSGKSVCINAIITCLLMQVQPQEVRMIMIDPKRVEMVGYNDIPHLLCPVVCDMDKVVGILRWVAREMDERYKKLAAAGARNIEAYNKKPLPGQPPMPQLVVIIDELADLMMVAPDEVERILCRLAQLARATGIHLVVATQRPSVDVITGLIKANFPTRISFAVTSLVDSRTILDQAGAEKLLGRGDMLFLPPDAAKPVRVQGVFLSDAEIERVVEFWKNVPPPAYSPDVEKEAAELAKEVEEDDPLLEEARELAEQHSRLSISFLQRRLRVGYNRAARIYEILAEEGLVEPFGGSSKFSDVDEVVIKDDL